MWLAAVGKARATVGDELFFKVLGSHGYENAQDVNKPAARQQILAELR